MNEESTRPRVLFITQYVPADAEVMRIGVFQRMGLLLRTAAEVADVDALFYVSKRTEIDEEASRIGTLLSTVWGVRASVTTCHHLHADEEIPPGHRLPFRLRSIAHGAVSALDGPALLTSGPDQLRAFEAMLDRRPEVVIAHRLGAMAPILLTRRPTPPVLFDLDDVEHAAFGRESGGPSIGGRFIESVVGRAALNWAERRAVVAAYRTFVCSEADRSLVEGGHVGAVRVLPNTVARADVTPLPSAPNLLFVGSFGHVPNEKGARELISDVFPIVRSAIPNATLTIVGRRADQVLGTRDHPDGVTVHGFVDDLGPLYHSARVVCCLLRSGGGTRIKILEAAAHGRPVVASGAAAAGLELADGSEIVLRDDVASFAEAVVGLLESDERAMRIARAGMTAVRARYAIQVAEDVLREELTTLLDLHA